jgi:TRAP-type C4-dicarboxylate transport system substrate-binding protein
MEKKRCSGKIGVVCAIVLAAVIFLAMGISSDCNAQAAKTWKLKFWCEHPRSLFGMDELDALVKDIEKRTNGRVVVTAYWGESLVARKEVVAWLRNGMVDMGRFATMMNPGEFPVADVASLPFTLLKDEQIPKVFGLLYKRGLMPEYESSGIHAGAFVTSGTQQIIFKKKPVTKLEDFKGLMIRSQTPLTNDLLAALGATPVAIGSGEVYMSLDRGVVDGALSAPGFMAIAKWNEVAKYFLDQPLYSGMLFYGVNKKVWDSFPDDIKTIMTKWFSDVEAWETKHNGVVDKKFRDELKQKGVVFNAITPEELSRWKNATQPIVDKFVKSLSDKGLQGQKIYDTVKEVVGK